MFPGLMGLDGVFFISDVGSELQAHNINNKNRAGINFMAVKFGSKNTIYWVPAEVRRGR